MTGIAPTGSGLADAGSADSSPAKTKKGWPGPPVESPPESLKGTRGQLELWLHQQMQEWRDPSSCLSFEKLKEGRVHEQK